jgi:hypothetical protein
MLRLQIQHLELQDRIERRPSALRALTATKSFPQNRPEKLKVNNLLQLLQRITPRRKLAQTILDTPKPRLLRQSTPPPLVDPKLADYGSKNEVSGGVHPHSGLKMRSPREFIAAQTATA